MQKIQIFNVNRSCVKPRQKINSSQIPNQKEIHAKATFRLIKINTAGYFQNISKTPLSKQRRLKFRIAIQ